MKIDALFKTVLTVLWQAFSTALAPAPVKAAPVTLTYMFIQFGLKVTRDWQPMFSSYSI